MKKSLIFIMSIMIAGVFTSCNLDYFPDDELNADLLLSDEAGAEYIMDGCYATLKDEVEFIGYASGNAYVRHYTQLAEFPGDNICLAGKTTDPLYDAMAYMMTDGLKNVGTMWWLAYKVIYMANTVIESAKEGENAKKDQLIGEAYYMRALMHLHMVTLFSKQYSFGADNVGVPLRVSTASDVTTRATVGECYNQIVKDLIKASELMTPSSARGNKGYANHDAALGLLTRVYLYMGKNDEVIKVVDELLNGADPASKLDNISTYFANAKTSPETLFCIAHEITDDKAQSSAGSMYNADGGGWGEIYPSNPLLYLYERYPQDKRYADLIAPQYNDLQSGYFITFPDPATPDNASGRQNLKYPATPVGAGDVTFQGATAIAPEKFTFSAEGNTYEVKKKTVNGEYFEYYVEYGGETLQARVTKPMFDRYNYYRYYVKKFGYQDGSPTLSSPVMQRWGEVILNAAEAYAQLGNDAKALDYVNVIRTRAGIPAEGLFAAGNMHGYASVLDVVLDERRLELAFEGHRPIDVYRHKQDMDRRYPGAQPWAVVSCNEPHIQYPIPFTEWSVSGIAQNPGY